MKCPKCNVTVAGVYEPGSYSCSGCGAGVQVNPGRETHLERAHEWARLEGQSKARREEAQSDRQHSQRVRETGDATISVPGKGLEYNTYLGQEDKQAVADTYRRSLRSGGWAPRSKNPGNPDWRGAAGLSEAGQRALFATIQAGSKVTIRTPQGQERTGTAVMKGGSPQAPTGDWVLDMGGKHGTPGMATPSSVVKVTKGRGKKRTLGSMRLTGDYRNPARMDYAVFALSSNLPAGARDEGFSPESSRLGGYWWARVSTRKEALRLGSKFHGLVTAKPASSRVGRDGPTFRMTSTVLKDFRRAPLRGRAKPGSDPMFANPADSAAFDKDDIEEWASEIKKGLNAPYSRTSTATYPGSEYRRAQGIIIVRLSLDERETWENGIFENSRWAQIGLSNKGTMEMPYHGLGKGKGMRKAKFKSADDAVRKINTWIQKSNLTNNPPFAEHELEAKEKHWALEDNPVTPEGTYYGRGAFIGATQGAVERKKATGKKVYIYESAGSTHQDPSYTLDKKYSRNKRAVGHTNNPTSRADYSGYKPLSGHTSEETAYIVDDYPYGFRLRTQIRYWVETKKGKGQRFVSQTLNPKTNRWNKPKASIYSTVVMMALNEEDHVVNVTLSEWASGEELENFAVWAQGHLTEYQTGGLDYLGAVRRAGEKTTWTTHVCPGPDCPEQHQTLEEQGKIMSARVSEEMRRGPRSENPGRNPESLRNPQPTITISGQRFEVLYSLGLEEAKKMGRRLGGKVGGKTIARELILRKPKGKLLQAVALDDKGDVITKLYQPSLAGLPRDVIDRFLLLKAFQGPRRGNPVGARQMALEEGGPRSNP